MHEESSPEEIRNQIENSEAQELSPEVLEVIMSKVQDINKKGIGFHTIKTFNWDDVKYILKNGLLGRTLGANIGNLNKWAKTVRKNKSAEVYFNITGRFQTIVPKKDSLGSIQLDENGNEIDEVLAPIIENSLWGAKESETFLFDLTAFKEVERPTEKNDRQENRKKIPVHGFAPNLEAPILGVDEEGRPMVNSQGGFELKARIAPRFFRGIVIGLNRNYYDLLSPDELRVRVDDTVKNMMDIYRNKQNLILPIYDIKGNLLWPKQMTCQEVQEFSTQKDEDKEVSK